MPQNLHRNWPPVCGICARFCPFVDASSRSRYTAMCVGRAGFEEQGGNARARAGSDGRSRQPQRPLLFTHKRLPLISLLCFFSCAVFHCAPWGGWLAIARLMSSLLVSFSAEMLIQQAVLCLFWFTRSHACSLMHAMTRDTNQRMNKTSRWMSRSPAGGRARARRLLLNHFHVRRTHGTCAVLLCVTALLTSIWHASRARHSRLFLTS